MSKSAVQLCVSLVLAKIVDRQTFNIARQLRRARAWQREVHACSMLDAVASVHKSSINDSPRWARLPQPGSHGYEDGLHGKKCYKRAAPLSSHSRLLVKQRGRQPGELKNKRFTESCPGKALAAAMHSYGERTHRDKLEREIMQTRHHTHLALRQRGLQESRNHKTWAEQRSQPQDSAS
jgi:hypothetical protein